MSERGRRDVAGEAFHRSPDERPRKRPKDPYDDPGYRAWARSVIDQLVPKLQSCNYMVSVLNEPADDEDPDIVSPKFCVELGVSIMLGKPLIVGIFPGWKIPAKLAMIADRIIETDHENMADFAERLRLAMKEMDQEEEAVSEVAGLRVVAADWVPAGTVYVCRNADGTTPSPEDVIAQIKVGA